MSNRFDVFDGHNDVALRFYQDTRADPIGRFLNDPAAGHVNLPAALAGRLVGGLFALSSPSPPKEGLNFGLMSGDRYDLPLPQPLELEFARESVVKELSMLLQLERVSEGRVRICRTTREIRECAERGQIAMMLHLEGAEAVDGDLHFLEVLYAAGLRSIGPVWSRHNIFGYGVPLKFPSGPDTGPGLTGAGKRLVEKCNRLGILVDLAHITERGFWDVAELSTAPLVATHSNAHELSAVARNLTVHQLRAIRSTQGLVGVNFATAYLRPDGQMRSDTDVELVVDHIVYLLDHLGESGVALGSDFDGALIPEAIGSAAGLPNLFAAMTRRGLGDSLISKIAFGNWMDVLDRTI